MIEDVLEESLGVDVLELELKKHTNGARKRRCRLEFTEGAKPRHPDDGVGVIVGEETEQLGACPLAQPRRLHDQPLPGRGERP